MRKLPLAALVSLGLALACAATAEAGGPRFFFGVNLTPGFYGGYGYPYGYGYGYPGYYPYYGYRPYPPPPPIVIQAPPQVMVAQPQVVLAQPAPTVVAPPVAARTMTIPAPPPAPAPFVAPQNYYNYPTGNYYYPY